MIFWPKNNDMFDDILAQKLLIFLPKIKTIKKILEKIIILVKNIVIYSKKNDVFG